MNSIDTHALREKYNVAGPRYTSYPTVPHWNKATLTSPDWSLHIADAYEAWGQGGISLYIHLPYCESLCTYCGCTTRITTNHSVELPYIQAVLTEWHHYVRLLGTRPVLRQLHLGGGTPTFFTPQHLELLVHGILKEATPHPELEMSLEGHPANTTAEHLRTLAQLGFSRLSLGVQDFDPLVQQTINRKQNFAQVSSVIEEARELGFEGINLDLLYGLPHQTAGTLASTLYQTSLLKPDRLAFYGYAHVPWLKPGQRSYEQFLPSAQARYALYEQGRQAFGMMGYREIGMDHFALPSDSLSLAAEQGTLHRNFMGYTTQPSRLMLGLGASAISDAWNGFAQNAKAVEAYMERIQAGLLPVTRGHEHSAQDLFVRQHILNLMCKFQTQWDSPLQGWQLDTLLPAFPQLEQLQHDGLIRWNDKGIKITAIGRHYVRNVCMAIDPHWDRTKENTFSKIV